MGNCRKTPPTSYDLLGSGVRISEMSFATTSTSVRTAAIVRLPGKPTRDHPRTTATMPDEMRATGFMRVPPSRITILGRAAPHSIEDGSARGQVRGDRQ